MGQAKARTRERELLNQSIKIPPRKQLAAYFLVHHGRTETQGENGMVYARNTFAVVNPATGEAFMEETSEGPKPVLLMSVPQPVRRSVISITR